jgi:hypothetical protein
MNISSTNSTYTNYANQTNSTSKTEKSSESFMSNLQDVSNKKEDTSTQATNLLDIQAYKKMTSEERKELRIKLKETYGEEKGKSYSLALANSSQYGDTNMQKAVFDNLSEMSLFEGGLFLGDIKEATLKYLSGQELKASYSIELDKNNQIVYGDSDIDTGAYFNNISSQEFEHLFSTLKASHDSMAKVVGSEQASKYSKVYEGILNSYHENVSSSNNMPYYA